MKHYVCTLANSSDSSIGFLLVNKGAMNNVSHRSTDGNSAVQTGVIISQMNDASVNYKLYISEKNCICALSMY